MGIGEGEGARTADPAETSPTGATQLEPGGPNAIAVTLGLLGDEWNLWILRHAVAGCRRYGDWIARGPISHAVLSARLATLADAGLVEIGRASCRERV